MAISYDIAQGSKALAALTFGFKNYDEFLAHLRKLAEIEIAALNARK